MDNPLDEAAFQCVKIPEFPAKPRDRGITMVLEYGLGLPYQQGLIDAAGNFLDLVKLGTGLSRILPKNVLKEKIRLYIDNNIPCFPGGQFFELAYMQKRADAYLDEAAAMGFSHVEISDNCIDLPPKVKADFIRRAIDRGLTVLGESGKKLEISDPKVLIDDLHNCRDAGAWKVFVEAAELISDTGVNMALVDALTSEVDIDYMIFEIPGQWMNTMTFSKQYSYWKMLIQNIGPAVNLANIQAEELLRLSLLRLGLGADTSIEKGAFMMSKRGEL
ncbi:MAG: hypothetical protein HKM93_16130 [Desulfobacteraceae bacterium]|nr:hypothetical protein [Desulfobacteraceae bacterium]